jgi:60 kDa SS-A/Ro ribonucleoprotein
MYLKQYSARQTPQTLPIPGADQAQNAAGGYGWAVDDWTRLDRFLVLGSEGGSYYVGEQRLTLDNADAVARCLDLDGPKVVARVVEISREGRAPKNDPALFVLAMAAGLGNEQTKQAALAALPQVARTGTHLFHFLAFVQGFRGWGRGLRRAVGDWYNALPAEQLAYQAIKYQRRDGWSHRDALRLAHPQPATAQHDAIFHWITQGWPEVGPEPHPDPALRRIWAFEQAKRVTETTQLVSLIKQHDLPWEAVPSDWLGDPMVWRTLLPQLPMTALLRNLARLTANGILDRSGKETALVTKRLRETEALRKARIHPIAVLSALHVYGQGRGMRGKLTWQPIPAIVDALDEAFYKSFRNITPSGKRVVLALDVSASMDWGTIVGVPGLTPRVAAAAMALVTAATEQKSEIVAFSHRMTPLAIAPGMRLDQVLAVTENTPFGRTDCALPMLWALEHGVQADAFIIYTDSETWAGREMHPAQALQEYRRQTGIPAKLIVVGMLSNGFSIADPEDGGMLDVVGFDTATPQVMADFVVG